MSGLVVAADANIPAVEEVFAGVGEVRRFEGRAITRDNLRDADVLLVRSVTRVDQSLLDGTPVRFVGTATSGFDHIDRGWLSSAGIAFAHAPGANANSVVEYVLCAVACVDGFLEKLLEGGSVGIVGCGNVGTALGVALTHLGIAWKVYDPWLDPQPNGSATLNEVLACDVVSLHPELTRAAPWPSYHLLDESRLASLNESQLLINASRGEVVDQAALTQRLQSPGSPACVLDVWEDEPAVPVELLNLVRFGSAHIAGYSTDGKYLGTAMLASALASALDLDQLAGQVHLAIPPEPAPAIELNVGQGVAPCLRSLLTSRYQVAEDDRRLRELLCCESGAAAAGFDRLRKHYPVRRELKGNAVHTRGLSKDQKSIVEALGCHAID
ncbi:MAG: 4-phosphoerythronate dehydrogenase [Halioglobus sp.]